MSSSLVKLWFFSIALSALVLASSPALGQTAEQRQDAIEVVRQANAHYDQGEFQQALKMYRRSYRLLDDARLLYRIGLTYENLGNFVRAREYLEDYLLKDPESQYAGRIRAKIEQLATLEKNMQSYLAVNSEPRGAKVFLDGDVDSVEGTTPVRIPVGAGEHTVVLIFEGRRKLEDIVTVEPGQTIERTYRAEAGTNTEAPLESQPKEVVAAAPIQGPSQGSVGQGNSAVAPGTFRMIDLGPPTGIIALSWAVIAAGNLMILAAIWPFSDADIVDPSAGYAGVAMVGAGVYMLAIHDWSSVVEPSSLAFENGPFRLPQARQFTLRARF
ncbi:MAG: PEGA domain-containing protein [Bradymonadaceae bacterium]|nr:PEGA domain-containing protein [Lujinxingiaceae bacterium]